MNISPRLGAYLKLEEAMLVLDDANDPLADQLRDMMDPLWYALSDEEHEWLDARPDVFAETVSEIEMAELQLAAEGAAPDLIGEAVTQLKPDPDLARPAYPEAA